MKYSLILVFITFLCISCGTEKEKKDHTNQRDLFNNSIQVIDKYKSKLSKSQNSTELDSLFSLFEEELGDLNMKYPAKTDFEMAEDENDTLSTQIMEIINLRDSIRRSFISTELPVDSVKFAEESHSTISTIEM